VKHLEIRPLEDRDLEPIAAAFRALGWDKPRSQYKRYLSEQREERRAVLVAFSGGVFAGYLTINWGADYPHFRNAGIPEIQDFNVLPHFRREGVGTHLMDEAERTISRRSSIAGIGVGISPDYGAAQRLYALRGYVPDGRGLISAGRQLSRGDAVTIDDGLALYLTKVLVGGAPRETREARPRPAADEPRISGLDTPSHRGSTLLPGG
jgi:ribosomal protein S18 acetylase RimI-like enzyme